MLSLKPQGCSSFQTDHNLTWLIPQFSVLQCQVWLPAESLVFIPPDPHQPRNSKGEPEQMLSVYVSFLGGPQSLLPAPAIGFLQWSILAARPCSQIQQCYLTELCFYSLPSVWSSVLPPAPQYSGCTFLALAFLTASHHTYSCLLSYLLPGSRSYLRVVRPTQTIE